MAVRMVKEQATMHLTVTQDRRFIEAVPVQYSAVLFRRRLTTRRSLLVNRERDGARRARQARLAKMKLLTHPAFLASLRVSRE